MGVVEMKEKSHKRKETNNRMPSGEKVLVLSNMYPSFRSKTFGIFVKNQVELLRKKGLNVDVIAVADPRKGKKRMVQKYGMFFLKNFFRLATAGKSYRAVHVHYIFPTGLAGLLYKYLFKSKLIVTSHGGDIDQMIKKTSFSRNMTGLILQKADHVIAVGDRLKQEIHQHFKIEEEKVSVINMGVNRENFYPKGKQQSRDKLSISHDEKMLVFVGNLIEAKGLNELLDAYTQIKPSMPELTLHLIGEPKNQAYFEAFQNKIADQPDIFIHPAKSQNEVADWLSAADVFVLPSHIEGFGLVALEAMACGVPVVGTDVGGLSYLLDEERGLKVKPHDAESLANAITRLIENPALQEKLIANGLAKAEEYDQNKLIEEVIKLYN